LLPSKSLVVKGIIELVAERQILKDSIAVSRCKHRGLSQRPAPLGALALKQVASAGPVEEHLSVGGDLEPFGHRLPGFNSLGASHKASLLSLCPVLRPTTILCGRTSERDDLGHLKTHFVLYDFAQGNVRDAILGIFRHERQTPASMAGI